ncbi:hypothetical protein FRC08_011988 [Ceratobasidium sp. 394]|nr:hypothetical protein FRC08_011988 [Ceratobasidium sp. 394]
MGRSGSRVKLLGPCRGCSHAKGGGAKIIEPKAAKAQQTVAKPKPSTSVNKPASTTPAKLKKAAIEGKVGTTADKPIYVLSQDPPIVIGVESPSSSLVVLNDDEFQTNNNKGAGQKRKANTSEDTPNKKVASGLNEETPYQILAKAADPKHLLEFSDRQSISNFFSYTISAKDQQIVALQEEVRAERAAKEAVQQELNALRLESRIRGIVKAQVSTILDQLGVSAPSARVPSLGAEGLGANPHGFGANVTGPTQPLGWPSNTGAQANPPYMGAAGPFQGVSTNPFGGAPQDSLPAPATSFAAPNDGHSFNAAASGSGAPM